MADLQSHELRTRLRVRTLGSNAQKLQPLLSAHACLRGVAAGIEQRLVLDDLPPVLLAFLPQVCDILGLLPASNHIHQPGASRDAEPAQEIMPSSYELSASAEARRASASATRALNDSALAVAVLCSSRMAPVALRDSASFSQSSVCSSMRSQTPRVSLRPCTPESGTSWVTPSHRETEHAHGADGRAQRLTHMSSRTQRILRAFATRTSARSDDWADGDSASSPKPTVLNTRVEASAACANKRLTSDGMSG